MSVHYPGVPRANSLLFINIILLQGIKLKGSAIELLEAMLEETNKKTHELVVEVYGNLDIGALHDTLCDFRTLMSNPIVRQEQYDDDAEAGLFRTYHVLVHFTHYGVDPKAIGECM